MMLRTTSKEIGAYLQWRIREWIKSGRTAAELAKLAQISGAQVSDVLNGNAGAGWKTLEGLAKAFGSTPLELMSEAKEWTKGRPAAPDEPAARALAAKLAREAGVSEVAVASVLLETPTAEQLAWPALRWANYMQQRAMDLMSHTAERPAPTQSVITTVDHEPAAPAQRRRQRR